MEAEYGQVGDDIVWINVAEHAVPVGYVKPLVPAARSRRPHTGDDEIDYALDDVLQIADRLNASAGDLATAEREFVARVRGDYLRNLVAQFCLMPAQWRSAREQPGGGTARDAMLGACLLMLQTCKAIEDAVNGRRAARIVGARQLLELEFQQITEEPEPMEIPDLPKRDPEGTTFHPKWLLLGILGLGAGLVVGALAVLCYFYPLLLVVPVGATAVYFTSWRSR